MDVNTNQKGSALISALFIMTIVAIVATSMSTRLQQDIYLTQLTFNHDKLHLAAQSATFWAMDLVMRDNEKLNKLDSKKRVATLPSELRTAYPGVFLSGELYDLQSRFNVNNLSDELYRLMFKRLLDDTLSGGEDEQALIDSLQQWSEQQIDMPPSLLRTLQQINNQGTMRVKIPVAFQDLSQFEALAGVSNASYQNLKPWITALPDITPININTAPNQIIRILADNIHESDISMLIQVRNMKPSATRKAQLDNLIKKMNINPKVITEKSTFFLLKTTASMTNMQLIVYSVLSKTKNKENVLTIRIISQNYS